MPQLRGNEPILGLNTHWWIPRARMSDEEDKT
jgi:hypothetical protein